MRSLTLLLAAAFAAGALLSGCGKSKTQDDPKPAEPGAVEPAHNKGDRGGKKFHLQEGGKDNHDYLCEYVFKDGKLAIYIIDHNDVTKTVKSEETELMLTGLKHDGKDLPPITLTAMEKNGENWFEATGDAIPKEVKDVHDLAGGKFSVTVGKTKLDGVIKKSADAAHKKEKMEKKTKTGT